VIRLVSRDGKISVLLTKMLNPVSFPTEAIIELYFRRWAIEDHYRNEKMALEVVERTLYLVKKKYRVSGALTAYSGII
jgi:hypothetical protein